MTSQRRMVTIMVRTKRSLQAIKWAESHPTNSKKHKTKQLAPMPTRTRDCNSPPVQLQSQVPQVDIAASKVSVSSETVSMYSCSRPKQIRQALLRPVSYE